MPIYEFRCGECRHEFEIITTSAGEVMEAACPKCGGCELVRIMSACSPVVKGGGSSAPQPSGPSVETRACANAGSCGTITLPGCD